MFLCIVSAHWDIYNNSFSPDFVAGLTTENRRKRDGKRKNTFFINSKSKSLIAGASGAEITRKCCSRSVFLTVLLGIVISCKEILM